MKLLLLLAFTLLTSAQADIAQQAYLKPAIPHAYDLFGHAVALDGDTMVAGAPTEDGTSGNDEGAVYVFVRQGGAWTQQAKLKANNAGAGDLFGLSVSLSGDTLVVGAQNEDSNDAGINHTLGGGVDNLEADSGAAYVFVRSGGTWTQQAYLKSSSPDPGDIFGTSVGISGNTVVVGARDDDGLATNAGAAYLFVRNGSTWSQQQIVRASNGGSSNRFGASVAISGNTIVAGAYGHDGGINNAGAAYVFVRSGTTWSQQAYLLATHRGDSDLFGLSVAISGETIVVGARDEDSNATGVGGSGANNSASNSGAAYVFTRSGTSWGTPTYLKASNTEAGDQFSEALAIHGDTIVIGALGEDSNSKGINGVNNNSAEESGAAYVFKRSGGNWSPHAYLKASNTGPYDGFAAMRGMVAVSGNLIACGAAGEDSGAVGVDGNEGLNNLEDAGALYVFDLDAPPDIRVEYPVGTNLLDGSGTLHFGGAPPAEPVTTRILRVKNAGGQTLTVTGFSAPAGFDCTAPALPFSLVPGATQDVTVRFLFDQPSDSTSGTLVLSSNDPDTEQSFEIQLIGTIPPARIVVEQPVGTALANGGTVDFGITPLGTPITRTFRLRNAGGRPLLVSGLNLPIGYALASPFQAISIPLGGTHDFQVQLHANLLPGSASGSMFVTTNDLVTGVFNVSLTGVVVGGGMRDHEFGIDGLVKQALVSPVSATWPSGSRVTGYRSSARDVAVLSSREIVVCGQTITNGEYRNALGFYENIISSNFHLIRYSEGGVPIMQTSGRFPSGDGASSADQLSLPADNQIIVGGTWQFGSNYNRVALYINPPSFTLDTAFGVGGEASVGNQLYGLRGVLSIDDQSSGAMIVAGEAATSTDDLNEFGVARLSANGILDTDFANSGIVRTPISTSRLSFVDMAVQPDDRIVVLGNQQSSVPAMVRYLPNGVLDASFGAGGKVLLGGGNPSLNVSSMALQADGKIVMAGVNNGGFAVVRYLPNGSPDLGFGTAGLAVLTIPSRIVGGGVVLLQGDGKMIVTATVQNGSSSDFGIVRFTPEGLPDLTFGRDGVVTIHVGSVDTASGATLQPDGNILLSGSVDNQWTILRYIPDYRPDVETLPAVSSGPMTSILHGTVDPRGVITSAWFEYGPTPALGQSSLPVQIGDGHGVVSVSHPLSGLASGASIYYRVLGQNGTTTARGEILSFTNEADIRIEQPVGIVLIDNQSSVEFGAAQLGAPVSRTVVVSNEGHLPLNISALTLPPGFVVQGGFAPFVLNAGEARNLHVTLLANTAPGNFSGTMTLFSNDPDSENSFSISLNAWVTTYTSAAFTVGINNNGGLGIMHSTPGRLLSGIEISLPSSTFFDTSSTVPGTSSTPWSMNSSSGGVTPVFPSTSATDGKRHAFISFSGFDAGDSVVLSFDLDTYATPDSSDGGLPNGTEVRVHFNDGSRYHRILQPPSIVVSGNTYAYGVVSELAEVSLSPVVVTTAASNVVSTAATLNGTVRPMCVATEVWFEYGPTTSYGSTTPVQTVSWDTSIAEITSSITGLAVNTPYRYRLVGRNAVTLEYGEDRGFTTTSSPRISVSGNGIDIASGDTVPDSADHTHFGETVVPGGTATRVFTITNHGIAPLSFTGVPIVAISGNSAFTVVQQSGAATVAAVGGVVTFSIAFAPSTSGTAAATVSIASDNLSANPFVFSIGGVGVTAQAKLATTLEQAGLTGSNAEPQAMPHGDGVPNLLKYAFNLNLAAPDAATLTPGSGTSGLPFIDFQSGEGLVSTLRYEYLRRRNSGLIYLPQQTGNLADSAPWSRLTSQPVVIPVNATWERIIYEEPHDTTLFPNLFGRVQITLPQ